MIYKTLIRPILFQRDPEQVHHQITALGKQLVGLPGGDFILSNLFAPPTVPQLQQTLWDNTFYNPIGLAAGFDKHIKLPPLMKALGFGFEEVGSISALPYPGNPKPRLFRLPEDEAIINRMGLNNPGVQALLPHIQKFPPSWPIGISIVKTPDPDIIEGAALEDFAATLKAIQGYGTYISINISCPNTKEGKTFEDPAALEALLARLRAVEASCQKEDNKPPTPWCLKISPDIDFQQLQEIFEVACHYHIAGWISCNTTAKREGLKTSSQRLSDIGNGGLSGQPLQQRSTQVLGQLYQLSQGQQILIGVGGVHDAASAWEKITHGASLIQIYTGFIYEGPGLLKQIQNGLCQQLEAHGFSHINEAIGSAFR